MVNIVVVCWNALKYTKNTLESLCKSIELCDYENIIITLINNGSTDDTNDYLIKFSKECPFVVNVINNEENIGIGAAYNQGLRVSIESDAQYTVFCNNDLLFTNGWFNKMKNILDLKPDIAMLGPIVPSSSSFFNKTTTLKEKLFDLKEGLNIEDEFKNFIDPYLNLDDFEKNITKINNEKYDTNLRIIHFPNAISSCMVMARTSIFKNIGFFANPEFKEYGGEDIDICWTILKMGYKIAVTNDVYIHHYRGKSIKEANFDRSKLLKKSNLKLFNIWKKDIINYYRKQGVNCAKDIKNTPENWLINELKGDVDLDKEFKYEF